LGFWTEKKLFKVVQGCSNVLEFVFLECLACGRFGEVDGCLLRGRDRGWVGGKGKINDLPHFIEPKSAPLNPRRSGVHEVQRLFSIVSIDAQFHLFDQ
jgi:hypothetical protein